ncbi:hypothetical protein [Streptomyces chartreusis]|uniref:hypothetical protein n=1 Tax=Streptomyces chartreusis TaxID=1969 RepID=UPI0033CADA0A
MVSFEPDEIEVSLDGVRLRLEPGQNVVSHGVDRNLDLDEARGPCPWEVSTADRSGALVRKEMPCRLCCR